MSPLTTKLIAGPPTVRADVSNESTVEALARRLAAEIRAAEERVRSLQSAAATDFVGEECRLADFISAADRINAILLQRLQALTELQTFSDVGQVVSSEPQGLDKDLFNGRTITLTVPNSDQRPSAMEFSFRVGHDESLRNVVVDYRLEIRPIFVKFNGHNQIVTPINDLNDGIVAKWIDDKLIEFTRTYFEVYFHHEYQKSQLVTDPVMNLEFPKAFAVGKREHAGNTYYLYTPESLQAFESNPSKYGVKLELSND